MTGATDVVPWALGVAQERERAMGAAEGFLRTGEGFLSLVEAVRPALAVHGLDPYYARTGVAWIGRLSRSGEIVWSRILVRGSGLPLS